MESNTTLNGIEETAHQMPGEKSVKFMDNNNEGENTGENQVTHAEVNHQLTDEPIIPKRNVFPETDGEKKVSTDVLDETDGDLLSTSALPETSENFIKIEERKVIERLSRVIDSELSIETFRVDTEDATEEVNDNKPEESELQSEEPKPVPEDSNPEPEEPVIDEQESETNEEINRFHVSVSHEKEESVEDNTPKTEDTFETSHEVEVRREENHFQDNGLNTEESNHQNEEQNDETFETQNENHGEENEENTKPVVEDVLIKQNGRKIVYSSEEDVEEEADQMSEIIGFKSTLKKWSTGKPGQSENTDLPPVDTKDKFKTLRQIKRGNTRSLMEKFQSPAKS